jgi:hypothetical protein
MRSKLSLFLQTIQEWYVVAGAIFLNILTLDECAFALEGFSWLKTSALERKETKQKARGLTTSSSSGA